MLDYYDIETWKPGLKKYTDSISRTSKTKKKSPKFKSVDLSTEELITREVYALLNSKLDTKPNGMMTRLQGDNMPLNSLWWWDFTFESDIGSISILKGNTSFEAQLFLDDESFDIVKFLKDNLTKYSELVDETIGTYELHRTYINHYQSYKTTTRHLYDKIQALDLTKPEMPRHSDATGESVKAFVDSLQQYTLNSVEYHALGKSLLLHSAFMAETFINLLIRVGASSTIREQKHLLDLHLNSNFKTKLQNLNVLCMYTTGEVEVNSDPVKNILEVMTMRNKYVHGDESSRLNRLDDVYFDELFPLYDLDSNNIAINSIQNTYHNPPRQDVERAYESANTFIEYVSSLIHPDAQYEIDMIMEQNPIGYNSKTHKYSVIYPTAMAFGMPVFGKD